MREDVVAAAIIRRADGILLVHNYWPAGDAWNLPGGRKEPGEAVVDAVAREVREETGLLVTAARPAYVFDVHDPARDFHLLWHVFTCTADGEAAMPDGDEFVREVAWVPIDRLDQYLWPSYLAPVRDVLAGASQGYYLNRNAGWGR